MGTTVDPARSAATGDPRPPDGSGLPALLRAAAEAAPDRVAVGVADGSRRLTYGQLGSLTRDTARRLADAGVTPGSTVALCCDNRLEFVVALLGAWDAGATVLPVDPDLTPDEIRARVTAAGATALVLPASRPELRPSPGPSAGSWALDVADGDGGPRLTPLGGAAPPARAAGPPSRLPAGTALLLSTTGSTGAPKTVPLTHGNVAASVRGIRGVYGLSPQDATVVVMPLYHGHGLVAGLLATLGSGGAAWLPATGRFSASRFWAEVEQARATWFTAVPTVHQILLARAGTGTPPAAARLRFVRSCSAPLAPAVARLVEDRFGAPVVQAYGMTETAHQATSQPLPGDGPRAADSVGRGTGVEVRVLTDAGTPAPPGTTGEICLRGAAVAAGYLDDPAATAAAFTDGWFRTGDLGHLDAGGDLFLTGRIKDLVNRGGEKIAPQTVEAALLTHPAVREALAFPEPDPHYGEVVEAAAVLWPGAHATEAELLAHCRARLAAFEVPGRVHVVEDVPRTAKGDGDRRALAALFAPPAPAR